MKMTDKKISILLGFILFFALCTPALASDPVVTAPATPSILSEAGIVKEVNGDQLTIETKNTSHPVLTLNLSDSTIVMDNKTGLPASVSTLKKGDGVYAYFNAAMTRSLPPQSAAIAVLTNFKFGVDSPAHLLTVGSIETRDNNNIRILSADGSMLVTVTDKTPISLFNSNDSMTLADIKVGTNFFAWYDVVALSYPGQAGADKVVVLPASKNPVTSVKANGKPLNVTTFTDHGNIMVPVRAVGEALGFTVTWNPADKSVSLDDGVVKTRVTLGQDSYYKASSKAIGLTAPFQYGSAPVVVDGRIYVPVQLFTLLYSNENAVTLSDGVLSIVSK